jgi:hypothetical protein
MVTVCANRGVAAKAVPKIAAARTLAMDFIILHLLNCLACFHVSMRR